MKFKKFLSILMVCVMGAGALTACAPETSSDEKTENDAHATERGELKVLQSGITIPPEDRISNIKAEYLIENQGYRDSDEVVAILSLGGDALIDSYLKDEELSAKISLAEYAASPMGKQKKAGIEYTQTDLLRRLQSEGYIKSVEYRYQTIANALAVTMTYGNFLALEEEGLCESVSLSETYARPLEDGGLDASAIVNDVEVYDTGIFNPESAKDPNGDQYTGKGTSVAVLDSGFDLSHQVFNTYKLTNEDELMYKRSDIQAFLDENDTNAEKTTEGLLLTDVFYSNKIPYKYDYADKDSDVFPFDSEHGTHVAGIIGGYATEYTDKDKNTVYNPDGTKQEFKGIAKDTQLVLMKVFPDLTTGAETDDILAALEDAVLLGVDAINMSLGAACGFSREKDGDVVNTVYDKINASGTSLITAAGNEYSSGFGGAQGNTNFVTNPDSGTIGSPASYKAALSVASISGVKSKYLIGNNEQVFFFHESNSIAGEENDFFGELYDAMGWEKNSEEHTLQYVTVPGYGYRANYTAVDVKGKIALVSRGDNTFEDKALQAKTAGAVACIIYNNIEGDILMSMGKSDHIPTVSISKEDGVRLAQKREGTLTFSYDQQAGPFMSDFSCWGPLPDLTLKPEITAHGGNITSSAPGGGFITISGTSMACPNLCGIVVLIRQYIKDNYEALTGNTDTDDDSYMLNIKNLTNKLLMSTGTIVLNEQGNPYSPRKQGAGLASLYNVVNTRAYIEVEKNGVVQDRPKLELGDDAKRTGVYEMYFDVVNISESPAEYDVGIIGMTESVSSADDNFVAERDRILGGSIKVEVASGSGAGTVSGTSVTVNAKSTLKLKLTYTLSQEDKDLIDNSFPYGMYVEGYLTLLAKGEKDIDLNVPFLAFYGDWTQAPIFDKTYYEVETEAHNAGIDEEDKLKADYYATTPYGSYWYNYIIPLGTYLYQMDESQYDPIPATEDRIAISNSLNSIDGISNVYAGLLRGCKTMMYTITDKATGEVIFTKEVTNARKAFSQGGSPIPNYEELKISSAEYGLVNNRMYEFKMEGFLDYGDGGRKMNARNSFSFDFTLDSEAPIIKSASYEKIYDKTLKKDRYYVTLTVYDNTYAMSVAPGVFTDNPDYDGTDQTSPVSFNSFTDLPIPLYGGRGEEVNVRIEITDYLADLKQNIFRNSSSPTSALPLNNCLVFSIDDYALNQNLFLCSLPGTDGPFAFTNDGTEGGTAMTRIEVGVNEVVDLTQYLVTEDASADGDKDYLKHLVWQSSAPSNVAVQNGQIRGLKTGRSTITVYEPMYGNSATIIVLVVNKAETASAYGTQNSVSPLAFENAADATQERIKELRFSSFETLFAHALAGQPSDIGSTGETVFLTAHRGGISMYPGETIQLSYDVTPWYVRDNYTYSYRVDREDIAIVREDGTVQALKKGNATVTLRVYDKNGKESNIMATLRITVNSEFVIDDARTLVAYKGMGGDVVIPNDEGILYIGPFSFSLYETNNRYAQELPENDIYANRIPQQNATIRSVVVPDGVTEIQQNAFYHCTGLEKVVLPDTVRFLRRDTFTGDTSLKDINLGNVEVIASNAFAGCTSLKTVDLSKCYSIDDAAFKGAGLTEVDVTKLRNAGPEAFMNCKSLASVTLGPLTKLAEHIFDGCILTSVECFESNIIPAYAFANNKLTSVKLSSEEGLDLIGDNAFAGNADLTEITLPNSAFTLGQNVFTGCKNLATVKLQQKTQIASAQGAVFSGCGVKTFALASGVTANDYYNIAEEGKQLLSKDNTKLLLAAVGAYSDTLTVPASIKSIGASAFAGSALKEVTFSGPVSIGEYAFTNCSALTKVTFAGSGNEVGNYAFYNCKLLESAENLNTAVKIGDSAFASDPALKTVTLGDNVTLGNEAFRRSGLTEVTLGANATLGAYAFADCNALQTVTMPDAGGVKIGGAAFANDTRLSTIDLAKAAGELGAEAFYSCRALTAANLANITKVGANAFTNCAKLNSVTLGDDLTSIGAGAFMDLTYVTGGNSRLGPVFTAIDLSHVTELGEMAFLGCSKLKDVTLASLAEIPAFAFAYCTSLSALTLPQSCTKIGDFAFANCTALTSLTNMGNVTEIGEGAFNLAGGRNFTLDLSAVRTVGEGAFADSALSGEISAPALTSVGSFAFENAAFTSIDAPALAVIGEGAFAGNTALTSFNFSTALTHIDTYAFYGCTALADFTFGAGKANDGKINEYAKLLDGVLYTALRNGKQQLTSVPAGKNITALTVEEGTSRIDAYAGNANTHVTSIVLPDSLDIIGEFAFYGYTGLTNVEFKSVTAPKLESGSVVLMNTGALYDAYGKAVGTRLAESAPGYELLHDLFSLYGEEMYYFNFVTLVGSQAPIAMTLPKNSDLSGYDNIVYRAYFGSVEDAARSNYTAMEQSMKDFLWLGKQVAAIESVMLTDEALISKAVVALNGVKQDPAAYGVDTAEWNALKNSVLAARDRIVRLKIEYAKKAVRDIQARIDALDSTYKNTAEQDAEILALRDAIANLELDDRSLLIQDKYTTLLNAYQAAHPTPSDPGPGGENPGPGTETPPEESDSGCGSVIEIGLGGGIAAIALLLGAALIVTKKKEN